MKKLLKRYTKPFVAVILSVSLLISDFCCIQAQAAQVAVPTTFTLLETLFMSLGFNFSLLDASNSDPFIDQFLDDVEEYKSQLETANSPLKDAAVELQSFVINIQDHVKDGAITISDSVWDALLNFAYTYIHPVSHTVPSDMPDLSGLNKDQFCETFALHFGLDPTNSQVRKFFEYVHFYSDSCLIKYASAALTGNNYDSYYIYDTNCVYWKARSSTYVLYNSNQGRDLSSFSCLNVYSDGSAACVNSSGTITYNDPYPIYMYVNARPLNFWNYYTTLDNDSLYNFYFEDAYENAYGTYSGYYSMVNTPTLDDAYEKGTYDVLTPGREWDEEQGVVTGDVIINIPGQDVLDGYSNGTIPWNDALTHLGANAVDTNTGVDVNTGENIADLVTPVYGDGLIGLIERILDILSGLVDALLDGIASLFIPDVGFFEDWFTSLNDFFSDRFGFLYKPFDVLFTLLNSMLNYDPTQTQLYFPGIYWQEYEICPPTYVDLDISSKFPKLTSYMHLGTNLVMIFAFLMLVQKKFEEAIKK